MQVSLEDSFLAVLAYSNGMPIRLPRTTAGIEALRTAWEVDAIRSRHPDGRRSEDIDWDEIGRAVDEYHQHYGPWEGDE